MLMNPVCPVFRRCGGCALLDMDYAAQLEAKRRRLEALLGGLVKPEGIEAGGGAAALPHEGTRRAGPLPLRPDGGNLRRGHAPDS